MKIMDLNMYIESWLIYKSSIFLYKRFKIYFIQKFLNNLVRNHMEGFNFDKFILDEFLIYFKFIISLLK